MWQRFLQDVEQAHDVAADVVGHLVGLDLAEIAQIQRRTRRVDDAVDAAKFGNRAFDGGANRGGINQIDGKGLGANPQSGNFRHQRIGRLAVAAIGNGHGDAIVREGSDHASAKAARAANDQRTAGGWKQGCACCRWLR